MSVDSEKLPLFGSSPLGRNGYQKNVSIFVEPSHRSSPRDHNYKGQTQIRIQWEKGQASIWLSTHDALHLAASIVDELDDVYPVELIKAAFSQVFRQQGALYKAAYPKLFSKGDEL